MSATHCSASVLIISGQPRSLINFRGSLLQTMRERGHRVIAAAPGLCGDRNTAMQLEAMGVSCIDIPLNRAALNPVADIVSLLALIRLARSQRPDVVFAYTVKPVIFGLIAASIAGPSRRYPLITGLGYAFSGRVVGKRLLVQTIVKGLYRIALRHAQKVFFQNEDDVGLFRRLSILPENIPAVVVNGSGVDLQQFPATSLPAGPTRFLLIARLLSAKGIREYAAAANIISRERWPVEFHLVGGLDPNPDAISAREIETWKRNGTLVWHGDVVDVRPHIAKCHVFVLPSYREGTPRSVLEAMAMGRAIITTDAPGCRETVIDGYNGFLVPPQSVEPLALAMMRFLADRGLTKRMGNHSRLLAESKFDVRAVNAIMMREMGLS